MDSLSMMISEVILMVQVNSFWTPSKKGKQSLLAEGYFRYVSFGRFLFNVVRTSLYIEKYYNWAQFKKLGKQQQTQRKVEIEIKAKVGVDKYGDNKNPTKLIKPKDCSFGKNIWIDKPIEGWIKQKIKENMNKEEDIILNS